MQNIINSVICAENCENKNYIEFLSNLVNKLLDTLINTGNTIESPEDNIENKNKFTPDNTFFELYQQLNKTNTSENKLLILDNSSILVTISPVVLLLILFKGSEKRCLKK